MKKIFTLALTLLILNAAFSQTVVSRFSVQTPNFGISYKHGYGNGYNSYNNGYNNGYDRNYRIQHINDIYEQQANEIMSMPISYHRKMRLIRQLQFERARKIDHVDATSGYDNYNYRYYNNSGWR